MMDKFIFYTRSTLIRFLLFVLTIALVLFVLRIQLLEIYQNFISRYPTTESIVERVEEAIAPVLQKGAEDSTPLKAKEESPTSFLSVSGVVKFTNDHRAKEGLPALSINLKLNQSALLKAQDMFKRQYFEHDSPDGIGADGLAKEAGYSYILIGENLALGNFLNDTALVQGWMDSPGHRENIMHKRYSEIGVAVLRGTYNGRSTWMAVQHFGLPLSACPAPSTEIKDQISTNEAKLAQLASEIQTQKADLDATDKNDPSYNTKVEAYNTKVSEYNALLHETEGIIADYNVQVDRFNKCAS